MRTFWLDEAPNSISRARGPMRAAISGALAFRIASSVRVG
jgi:hypothetical protein